MTENLLKAERELRQKMPPGLWDQWVARNETLNRKCQQREWAFKRGIMILGIALCASLALAGCQDRFRYECQDPANHFKQQCLPPACEANGTCTKYLIKGETNEN